jgi:hypothetical protein
MPTHAQCIYDLVLSSQIQIIYEVVISPDSVDRRQELALRRVPRKAETDRIGPNRAGMDRIEGKFCQNKLKLKSCPTNH